MRRTTRPARPPRPTFAPLRTRAAFEPRLRAALAATLLGALSCHDVTAADYAPVQVVLNPKPGSAACVVATPEPAAVRVKQGIAFVNNSTVHLTIVLVDDHLPLVSVAPQSTSSAVKFHSPGIREYYSQACGSGVGERHTLAVTVN